MIAAAMLVTIPSLLLPWMSSFISITASQAITQAAGVFFPPAIAAVTLGIFGHRACTIRSGRNETFNHAGNACVAAVAGGVAYICGPTAVFYQLAAMAFASLLSIATIPAAAIDNDLARGLHATNPGEGTKATDDQPSGWTVLLTCRPLLIFAVCALLFHLANAAMLPLVGQKLALQDRNIGTSLMSACIVAAQIVMVPMAMLVGTKADKWGHKAFFLAALLVLPVRGMLYTLSDDRFWLVGVQLLDGIGAGIFGAIFPVIVADLMRGTGHFNLAQGAVITVQGIGAAFSTSLAGLIVVRFGYSAAFLTLGTIGALGAIIFLFAMPSTMADRLNSANASRCDTN